MVGTIQSHRGRGRRLGYPTLNLALTQSIPHGVYAGYVWLENKKFAAAIFVGPAISFEETDVQLEAHLLDATVTVNQSTATIECIQWLRPNQKFVTAAALQRQIAVDIKHVRSCLLALSKK